MVALFVKGVPVFRTPTVRTIPAPGSPRILPVTQTVGPIPPAGTIPPALFLQARRRSSRWRRSATSHNAQRTTSSIPPTTPPTPPPHRPYAAAASASAPPVHRRSAPLRSDRRLGACAACADTRCPPRTTPLLPSTTACPSPTRLMIWPASTRKGSTSCSAK